MKNRARISQSKILKVGQNKVSGGNKQINRISQCEKYLQMSRLSDIRLVSSQKDLLKPLLF